MGIRCFAKKIFCIHKYDILINQKIIGAGIYKKTTKQCSKCGKILTDVSNNWK